MLVVGFVAGLLVGWNVLPQPAWAAVYWEKIAKLFKKKYNKILNREDVPSE